LATAVWRPQACTGAAFRLLATYGRDRRLRRRRRVVLTRNLTAPTTARTVAAVSGSACRFFLTRRRLPRHHLRPQTRRRRQHAVVGHQVLARRRHQRAGLRDWLARPECWGEAAPGTVFDYANLGYVLIAAMAERMAGARFDRLARRELARIGVEGGFNWSGVPPAARARRLATYRRAGGRFLPQIDGQVSARGLSGPEGRELRLGSWRAGEAPGVFSPQGGLRINLSGALGLARSLSEADGPVLWSGPTDAPEVFQSYGLGVQFLDTPAFWPRPVMGHFGNAYGFAGGLWKDRVTGVAFVVALNGLPEGDEDDRLREEELALYGALAHACG
jgi:CubicO group peptidase (beta-lactamase class C family)